eukprot:2608691-Pyramimonas_sp.AAC.1
MGPRGRVRRTNPPGGPRRRRGRRRGRVPGGRGRGSPRGRGEALNGLGQRLVPTRGYRRPLSKGMRHIS